MPELPEVEVICQGLKPHVEGRKIDAVFCGKKELRLLIPREKLVSKVAGFVIVGIHRRAKYLLFDLDNSCCLVIHLGMTGRLGIFPQNAPETLHDHLCFRFDNGMEMRFNDVRRFGFVLVQDGTEDYDPFAKLGPEPFGDDFTAEYLWQRAGKRLQPVKNFLMDSQVVAGIGNIYANEILFYTGLNPVTPIGSISKKKYHEIVIMSRQVLSRAIESGGTTISDYVNASGKTGYFQLQLAVYGRKGESCHNCGTLIEKSVIGGRATFFCPQCQR
jgi:formamidopyrimidine-DNA glycosylase